MLYNIKKLILAYLFAIERGFGLARAALILTIRNFCNAGAGFRQIIVKKSSEKAKKILAFLFLFVREMTLFCIKIFDLEWEKWNTCSKMLCSFKLEEDEKSYNRLYCMLRIAFPFQPLQNC
jgi:hypothetical protein